MRLGFVSQSRDDLDPSESVVQVVSGGAETVDVGGRTMHVRGYLARFNLIGEAQQKLVKHLSGGERCRVHLARAFRTPSNFIILDEPTNDLGAYVRRTSNADVDTLRSLEEALEVFPGSAMIVSHDRYFLDRVCTHTLAFEGCGKVRSGDVESHRWSTLRGRTRSTRSTRRIEDNEASAVCCMSEEIQVCRRRVRVETAPGSQREPHKPLRASV